MPRPGRGRAAATLLQPQGIPPTPHTHHLLEQTPRSGFPPGLTLSHAHCPRGSLPRTELSIPSPHRLAREAGVRPLPPSSLASGHPLSASLLRHPEATPAFYLAFNKGRQPQNALSFQVDGGRRTDMTQTPRTTPPQPTAGTWGGDGDPGGGRGLRVPQVLTA